MLSTTTMDWQLGDVQTSPKGIRSAQLTDSTGSPIIVHLADLQKALTAPFGSSAFNDPTASRQNICFRVDPELEEKIATVDTYMADYVKKHAARLFKGKQMTYKPLLLTKDDYPPLIRCKINVRGTKACRCWTPTYERCEIPDDLRECRCVPRVQFKSLWVMGSDVGLSVEVLDLMVDQVPEECPFVNDNPYLLNKY